jgi:type IV secretion system protein TrbG
MPMRVLSSLLIPLALAGCASTNPAMTSIPIPDDLGWTQPVAEAPPDPPGPSLPPERPPSPFEKIYDYEPGQEYKVDVAVGFPLDIMLQVGELINDQTHGDRAPLAPGDEQPPWDIKRGASGMPEAPHIFVTVTKPGLATGLTLTTNKRVYLIHMRSVSKSKIRLVRWTYPLDAARLEAKPRLLPDPTRAQGYHVGYGLEASEPRPVWMPRQVLDDGRKTYVLFPVNLAVMPAPMVRLVGPNGYELVNARQVGSVMVLDHLFNVAELRIGTGKTAETVRIVRQAPRTITCPSDPACPVWPQEGLASVHP